MLWTHLTAYGSCCWKQVQQAKNCVCQLSSFDVITCVWSGQLLTYYAPHLLGMAMLAPPVQDEWPCKHSGQLYMRLIAMSVSSPKYFCDVYLALLCK